MQPLLLPRSMQPQVPVMLMEPMEARHTPAVALLMRMAFMVAQHTPAALILMRMVLMVAQPTPTAPILTRMALMAARLTTIPLRILPTLMEPMAVQLTHMMVQEKPMVRMVAQLPGVGIMAGLMAPMAARPVGAMVPVPPKVHVAVQRVGIVVQGARQHQLAENPEVGAGKIFQGMRENLVDFSSLKVFHLSSSLE